MICCQKKWIYYFFVSVVQDLLKNNIVTPVTFDPLEVQVSLVLQSNWDENVVKFRQSC